MKIQHVLVFLLLTLAAKAQIKTGADQTELYLPLLKDKKVALLMNHTSIIGDELLVDKLLEEQIQVVKLFVPEHGFRGTEDAGADINSSVDEKTKLPVVSLYGRNKKPTAAQLADMDVVVYDLQDVGVRFYTYISTLQYMMEACAEYGKELIVLDRPNPNGHYVAGPILDTEEHRSFVGLQPIPIVYGMTAGEYAQMLKGEKWIAHAYKLKLTVIPCAGYDHTKKYMLPVPPSPNLKTMQAVYLYPSLCLFEGTVVSVGRGTEKPFEQWGHPLFAQQADYYFIPRSVSGASKPLYEGQKCYGEKLSLVGLEEDLQLSLKWLIKAYQWYPEKEKFFTDYFEKLVGVGSLRNQIMQGMTDEKIQRCWEIGISEFKQIRKKYLLYEDFE